MQASYEFVVPGGVEFQLGSARNEVRGVASGRGCVVAECGTDGPARRSSSGEPGVLDGATANPLLPTTTDRVQDDQSVRTKLHAGSCLRILDQGLGSTRACSSRNRPLVPLFKIRSVLKGGLDVPCHTCRMRLTSTGTPAPDVDCAALVTH